MVVNLNIVPTPAVKDDAGPIWMVGRGEQRRKRVLFRPLSGNGSSVDPCTCKWPARGTGRAE